MLSSRISAAFSGSSNLSIDTCDQRWPGKTSRSVGFQAAARYTAHSLACRNGSSHSWRLIHASCCVSDSVTVSVSVSGSGSGSMTYRVWPCSAGHVARSAGVSFCCLGCRCSVAAVAAVAGLRTHLYSIIIMVISIARERERERERARSYLY